MRLAVVVLVGCYQPVQLTGSDGNVQPMGDGKPPAGLIARYTFEGADPKSDASGNGIELRFVNVTTPACDVGHCADFGCATLATAVSSMFENLPALTVATWMNPVMFPTSGVSRIVGKESSSGWTIVLQASGRLQFARTFQTADLIVESNAIDTGRWQHVAITWDGTGNGDAVKIYIDGVTSSVSSSGATGSVPPDDGDPLTLGNEPASVSESYFGELDDVQIYGRALDGNEIAAVRAERE